MGTPLGPKLGCCWSMGVQDGEDPDRHRRRRPLMFDSIFGGLCRECFLSARARSCFRAHPDCRS